MTNRTTHPSSLPARGPAAWLRGPGCGVGPSREGRPSFLPAWARDASWPGLPPHLSSGGFPLYPLSYGIFSLWSQSHLLPPLPTPSGEPPLCPGLGWGGTLYKGPITAPFSPSQRSAQSPHSHRMTPLILVPAFALTRCWDQAQVGTAWWPCPGPSALLCLLPPASLAPVPLLVSLCACVCLFLSLSSFSPWKLILILGSW